MTINIPTTVPLFTIIRDSTYWAQGDPATGQYTLDTAIVAASHPDDLPRNLSLLVRVLEEFEWDLLSSDHPLDIIAQWNDFPEREWPQVVQAISRYDDELDRLRRSPPVEESQQ